MFPVIYIEKSVEHHPRTLEFFKRYPSTPRVVCENYGEIFNKKSQNFRLQKQKPSLILAKKFKNHLLPIPEGFGIGGKHNFYFSHMLNCIYDCRYCFLQGMYASAHYVVFVNYEDFMEAISLKMDEIPDEELYFFSGYDCDSLAMEFMTCFAETFLPFFSKRSRAFLELRTKSIQIQSLLKHTPFPNCITAFSLTPEPLSRALEHSTPPIHKRLEAMQKLQALGWPVGIRFDPVLYCSDYKTFYKALFEQVFKVINAETLHSVSLGPFRLPKGIFKNIARMYPEEKLFAHSLDETRAAVSYVKDIETEMMQFCFELLTHFLPKQKLFVCSP